MNERAEKLIIGARLKRLRRTLGLTQAQMADERAAAFQEALDKKAD